MNPPTISGLRILILAAGFSSRLGKPKALARIRGLSLLRRTALLLAPFSARPLIVVAPPRSASYRRDLRGLGVHIVENAARASGLSGSLRLGLTEARWSAATLIVPVDLAELKGAELERLARRWRGAPRRIVARRIGARGGTPLILPKCLYSLASQLRGDIGLRDLLAHEALAGCILVDVPSAVRDIDTRADLSAARRARTRR
jgi:molybdenum cofactor cytidylyltransferase